MHSNRESRGFTLIELMVVLSIISILTIIALPNFGEAQTRAKVAATKSNLRNVAIKFELLGTDTNRYPLAGK
jgi:prepilin-type N-terminal cleavage/methylation domain-containing protein